MSLTINDREMTSNEKAELAYKITKELTGEENPPANEDFNDWVLRCFQAINDKLKTRPAVVKPKTTTTTSKG